jgi:hypothetical protein
MKLKAMRDVWGSIHPLHPSKESGFSIINYLLDNPELERDYIIPRVYEFIAEPTVGDIFEDLQNHEKFDSTSSESGKDASFGDFVKGWLNMGDGKDPGIHPPYCAFDVRCKSNNGLFKCMSDEIPSEFLTEGIIACRTGESEAFEWSLDMTPAFHITHPCMKECGIGRTLLGICGITIVFWWIHSKELLNLFGNSDRFHDRDDILTALKTWPALRWSILSPGEYVQMDVGMVYCTISPVNSAVSGWSFFDAKWLSNGLLEEVVTRELDSVEKQLKEENTDDRNDVSQSIRKGVEHWESCLNSPGLSKKETVEFRKLISDTKERLATLNS